MDAATQPDLAAAECQGSMHLDGPWMKNMPGLYHLAGARCKGQTAPGRNGLLELLAELIASSFAMLRSPLVIVISDFHDPRRRALHVRNVLDYEYARAMLVEVCERCQKVHGLSRKAEVVAILKERAELRERIQADWRRLSFAGFCEAYKPRRLSNMNGCGYTRGLSHGQGDYGCAVYLDSRPRRGAGRPKKTASNRKGASHADDDYPD